ncbi:glycerophosphodiester phosphodiesterase [Gilvimarinus sp. SDUM040013]|uniref:Glycerophosphodiester phosphodiesterase n=1 Tax=Gilvimarinus gilvus TaxID=3058038 RepID=A0ABU4RWP7_9GAMM|nr:glycerophosphodiester phosphodiesterase [Gilvimarinus sp. SDUM040013]MDO3385277.1 glycerophosphodiester phosphodiesterase [Gilvimarinus sp. SDUM040013]MDX6849260.1 glycerophosphodiester phosphodiesterase [Gilvimarinus sp. SDUM040013]
MKCIAHRGCSAAGTPENSLAAVQAAVELGVDGIEVDLWFLHGQFWVFHDRRLRFYDNHRIDELTYLELSQLRLDNGEPLASLDSILKAVNGNCLLNLEIKNSGGAEVLAQTIDNVCRELQLTQEHLIISSFNHLELYACRKLLPDIKIGVLLAGLPLSYAALAEPLAPFSFNTHIDLTTIELIADIHARGMESWVYTANFIDEWTELKRWRADAVFTDHAQKLMCFNER